MLDGFRSFGTSINSVLKLARLFIIGLAVADCGTTALPAVPPGHSFHHVVVPNLRLGLFAYKSPSTREFFCFHTREILWIRRQPLLGTKGSDNQAPEVRQHRLQPHALLMLTFQAVLTAS